MKQEKETTKEAVSKPERKHIRWERLDNTAHLFPVIAGESMTNVYRIFVELTEPVQEVFLQKALDLILPRFDSFNLRLRTGFFWYYLEANNKPSPRVRQENTFPCRYIDRNANRSYLFRVTWFENRINLEVFHVLTDGMGGINFLRELTYQYLRLVHPESLVERRFDGQTSFNREDSFLKNYKAGISKSYVRQKAFMLKGETLDKGELGVIHGIVPTDKLKEAARRYDVTINEYLVGLFCYAVYREGMLRSDSQLPLRVAVPVNLRPFFPSVTTKNFFVMVSAVFEPEPEKIYSFPQVLGIVKQSLKEQITKEHLEEVISYNVSNEKHLFNRLMPLFLKNLAINFVYKRSVRAQTSTVTNIGRIDVLPEYQPYIDMFGAFLTVSSGQLLKGTICSYMNRLMFTFSTILADTSVERCFFNQLSEDQVPVTVRTNGVFYD